MRLTAPGVGEENEPGPFYRQPMTLFLAVASALNYADRAAITTVLAAVRTDLDLPDV